LRSTKAEILASFQETTQQPYNNVFMDLDIEQTVDDLRTKIQADKEELDSLILVAFATCDGGGPEAVTPSTPQRLTAFKQLYDIVLGSFLTLMDNIANMVATNLTAYECLELLAKLLSKESIKMEECLAGFESEERGFSYEESELRLRGAFDRVCGSRARFINELIKLKKLEMFFCVDPEAFAVAAGGQTSREMTVEDLAEMVSPVTAAIRGAKTTLLSMIEAAKTNSLQVADYKEPLELFEGVFGLLKRSMKRIQGFQLECCLFREGIFDSNLDRAGYVSNLLLAKITAMDLLIFVRVAESALMYNLELAVKQETQTLTAFHKVFDPLFDPREHEEVIADIKRDVLVMRTRITGKLTSESEFANTSVPARLAKLLSRISNLEKHNLRNERELSLHKTLGSKAIAYIKLARDVENITYNEQNETYLKINLQSIRKLDRARNEIEAAIAAFGGLDSVLLQKLRDHIEKNRSLLDQKTSEFANMSLTIKFA
jgi:hypothetical protein